MVKLVKIDVDKNPAYAGQLRVQSIPTVYAFVNGQPVDGFVGALPESQIKAFVEGLTGDLGPSPIDEILAEAKAAPARFNHSTPGNGTPQHLAFEVLNHMAGIRVTHVPYKGTGPAIADLLGGQVQAAFATLASIE